MNFKHTLFAVIAATAFATPTAFGHSKLERSQPANGTIAQEAPKALELHFSAATKLVSVKLVNGAQETDLHVLKSAAPAKSFSVPLPQLVDGQYQARYMTIAKDGHPMSGKIDFTVKR